MEPKRGAKAAIAVAATALAAMGLAGCSSSGSGTKPVAGTTASGAVGAPVETSAGSATDTAATGTTTGSTTPSAAGSTTGSAAGGDSAKFCADFRNLDDGGPGPQVGAPIPPGTLAVFDRMAGEAPAPVKTAMKAATAAVHSMSAKVDAAGLAVLGTAMTSITAWVSDTAHCPV